MEAGTTSLQAYYLQQSTITDPRGYASLFDDLPAEILALVAVVQGLLVHPGYAPLYNFEVPGDRWGEIHLRSIPEMLERLMEMDPSPLVKPRPPERRLVSLCRDYGVLLVAMLRHRGVPARLRVGFGGYFHGSELAHWDHRITQYWDAAAQRWILVDPMFDEVVRARFGISTAMLDLTDDTPFLLAGEVWHRCRAGLADPEVFGDSLTDRGWAPIRYALLGDFDALNKVELIGPDAWHPLINKPERDVVDEERALLDEIAALTVDVDARIDELRALYGRAPYAREVQRRLREALPA